MPGEDEVFVGGPADDPAFAAFSEAAASPVGEPVEAYAKPLTSEQIEGYHARLDAIEPVHAQAAARLHTLFAG